MAKRHPKTRYEKLTFPEFKSLPDDTAGEIWNEHIEELKVRGQYNENADKDFEALIDKAAQTSSKK